MPRPRPSVDQRQHIIRCDDALWAKIVAAAEARGVAINPYLNFVLTIAMERPPSQARVLPAKAEKLPPHVARAVAASIAALVAPRAT